jgi:hypothetical protein
MENLEKKSIFQRMIESKENTKKEMREDMQKPEFQEALKKLRAKNAKRGTAIIHL